MKVSIKILNWDLYNKRSSDLKRPWWFSLSNTLVEDPDFFDFTHGEFKTWIYILSQGSRKQKAEFECNLDHAKNVANISQRDFLSAIDKLQDLKCVAVRDPSGIRPAPGLHITLQDNTEQNNIAQIALRVSDFEEVYKLYPRKLGKAEGIRKLQAQIKKREDLDLFQKAVERYAAHCKEKQTDEKFIKHFSSFVTAWRDWLDPETGTSTAKAAGDFWDFMDKGAT